MYPSTAASREEGSEASASSPRDQALQPLVKEIRALADDYLAQYREQLVAEAKQMIRGATPPRHVGG
jgi:hypothetical protein